MDLLERLNRRFGSWYEGLFGSNGADEGELRPKDILRRILASMEDGRREGLDGLVYVPNAFTLRIAVTSDDERDYLKAFLSAEELSTAVARSIAQFGYKTRGGLVFVIEEADATDPNTARVAVSCRFDAAIPIVAPAPQPAAKTLLPDEEAPVAPPKKAEKIEEEYEPGTVPAIAAPGGGGPALAMLLVRTGDGRSLEAFPVTLRGVTVGRSRQSANDIVLSDPQISKRHGRIAFERGAFLYFDENSTNGSRVNDTVVTAGGSYALHFGDVIRLGETTLTFRPVNHAPTPAAPERPAPAVPARSASLINAAGAAYRLASEMIAGRSVTSDITVQGANVSERHARLKTAETGRLTIEDLNTPGGTYVNGERIPPLFAVTLYDGDELILGQSAPLKIRIA